MEAQDLHQPLQNAHEIFSLILYSAMCLWSNLRLVSANKKPKSKIINLIFVKLVRDG